MSPTTDDPNDPRLRRGVDAEPGPQNDVYLVLSDEERAKGFVRPFRDSYRHVGQRPRYPTRELTDEERERWPDAVLYEEYPESESPKVGRTWTRAQLDSGCGTVTTMGEKIAQTYARKPDFYGATYCCGCRKHLPVGEFIWTADGKTVGS